MFANLTMSNKQQSVPVKSATLIDHHAVTASPFADNISTTADVGSPSIADVLSTISIGAGDKPADVSNFIGGASPPQIQTTQQPSMFANLNMGGQAKIAQAQ